MTNDNYWKINSEYINLTPKVGAAVKQGWFNLLIYYLFYYLICYLLMKFSPQRTLGGSDAAENTTLWMFALFLSLLNRPFISVTLQSAGGQFLSADNKISEIEFEFISLNHISLL